MESVGVNLIQESAENLLKSIWVHVSVIIWLERIYVNLFKWFDSQFFWLYEINVIFVFKLISRSPWSITFLRSYCLFLLLGFFSFLFCFLWSLGFHQSLFESGYKFIFWRNWTFHPLVLKNFVHRYSSIT